MGYGANLYLVPLHFNAKTKLELTRLCAMNNVLNGMKYNYDNVIQENDDTYTIQFYADMKTWQDPRDLSQEEISLLEGFNE